MNGTSDFERSSLTALTHTGTHSGDDQQYRTVVEQADGMVGQGCS